MGNGANVFHRGTAVRAGGRVGLSLGHGSGRLHNRPVTGATTNPAPWRLWGAR
jgi:hypothetical protein